MRIFDYFILFLTTYSLVMTEIHNKLSFSFSQTSEIRCISDHLTQWDQSTNTFLLFINDVRMLVVGIVEFGLDVSDTYHCTTSFACDI